MEDNTVHKCKLHKRSIGTDLKALKNELIGVKFSLSLIGEQPLDLVRIPRQTSHQSDEESAEGHT